MTTRSAMPTVTSLESWNQLAYQLLQSQLEDFWSSAPLSITGQHSSLQKIEQKNWLIVLSLGGVLDAQKTHTVVVKNKLGWMEVMCQPCIGGTLICWGGRGQSCRSGWGGMWVAVGTRMKLTCGAYSGEAEGSLIAGLCWVSEM